MRSRSQMRVVADNAIVVDGSACVNNHVSPDDRVWLYHGSREYYGSFADSHRWIKVGTRMHHRHPIDTFESLRNHFASSIVSDSDNSLSIAVELGSRAQNFHAQHARAMLCRIVIEDCGHRVPRSPKRRDNHLRVPARANDCHAFTGAHRSLLRDPRKYGIVEWPSALMPSRFTILIAVSNRMRTSSQKPLLSTYQTSSANFSSHVMALRPLI